LLSIMLKVCNQRGILVKHLLDVMTDEV
jgi:hypothetical protein